MYKGQQAIATVKIYVSPNVPITNFEDVKLPSYRITSYNVCYTKLLRFELETWNFELKAKPVEHTDLLKKVRKIEIKTRGLSRNIFAGEYHSAFKGRGMAFSEVREYQFGRNNFV